MFCSLRAKCYTVLLKKKLKEGGFEMETQNKLKGVKREAVELLDLSNYLRTLLLSETQHATSSRICSKGHTLYIQENRKKSLANLDDKVRVKSCGIHILKYGEESSEICECPFASV